MRLCRKPGKFDSPAAAAWAAKISDPGPRQEIAAGLPRRRAVIGTGTENREAVPIAVTPHGPGHRLPSFSENMERALHIDGALIP